MLTILKSVLLRNLALNNDKLIYNEYILYVMLWIVHMSSVYLVL